MVILPPPPTFHLFPSLPTEIRLQIWRQLSTPRLIEIGTSSTFNPRLQCGARPPISFSICQESRTEAKRTYTLTKLMLSAQKRVEIWVDLAIDTLYLNADVDAFYLEFYLRNRCVDSFSRLALSSHLYPALCEVLRWPPIDDGPGTVGLDKRDGNAPYLPMLREITFVSDWLDCEGDMTVPVSSLGSLPFDIRRPYSVGVASGTILKWFEDERRAVMPVVKAVSRKKDLQWKKKSPRSSLSREIFASTG